MNFAGTTGVIQDSPKQNRTYSHPTYHNSNVCSKALGKERSFVIKIMNLYLEENIKQSYDSFI